MCPEDELRRPTDRNKGSARLSYKHLPAYLDEFEFRFNNRENQYIFRDVMRELLTAENIEYKELVA